MKVGDASMMSMITGVQHMRGPSAVAKGYPARAQTPTSDVSTAPSGLAESGKIEPANGKNLPPAGGAVSDPQAPQDLDRVSHALERLQYNLERKPENPGLQHALEMVQRNQQRH
jgi:hypothetical protein